jgi:hypothetical protein
MLMVLAPWYDCLLLSVSQCRPLSVSETSIRPMHVSICTLFQLLPSISFSFLSLLVPLGCCSPEPCATPWSSWTAIGVRGTKIAPHDPSKEHPPHVLAVWVPCVSLFLIPGLHGIVDSPQAAYRLHGPLLVGSSANAPDFSQILRGASPGAARQCGLEITAS